MFKSSTWYKDSNTDREANPISLIRRHTVHNGQRLDYLQGGYLSFSLSYINPQCTFCSLRVSKSVASSSFDLMSECSTGHFSIYSILPSSWPAIHCIQTRLSLEILHLYTIQRITRGSVIHFKGGYSILKGEAVSSRLDHITLRYNTWEVTVIVALAIRLWRWTKEKREIYRTTKKSYTREICGGSWRLQEASSAALKAKPPFKTSSDGSQTSDVSQLQHSCSDTSRVS